MRPGGGSSGFHGERGGAKPGRHAFQDTAGVEWSAWMDTSGFMRVAAFTVTEAAGFNFNTGGSALSFREGPDGTAANPARTYLLDNDTGPYRIGANNEGFSAGGTLRWDYNTSRIRLSTGYAFHFGDTVVLSGDATGLTSNLPHIGPVGTASVPAFTFTGFLTTGIWYNSAQSSIDFTFGGSSLTRFGNAAVSLLSDSALFRMGVSVDLVVTREAANHWFQRNSTTAQRASWANTYTSTVSYEAVSIDWQTVANSAIVGTRTAATGTTRPFRLAVQLSNAGDDYSHVILQQTSPFLRWDRTTGALGSVGGTSTTGNWVQFGGSISSIATAGSVAWMAILPTYNQTSGTAANTDLLINRTQTAVGSGSQRLIDAQVGGASQFSVSNIGAVNVAGSVTAVGYINSASSAYTWTGRGSIHATADGVFRFTDTAGTAFGRLNFGGDTSSFPSLKREGAFLSLKFADDSGYSALIASLISFAGAGTITTNGDGIVTLQDSAGTSFARLQFGGTSSSFPALKRSSATIQFRLADDSAYANAAASGFTVPVTTGSGIGYAVGAGGTVTQLTSKSTGVTLSKMTGEITMDAAALAADTTVSFTLTNTIIAAGDHVLIQHVSGGTVGSYTVTALAAAGSATVTVRNITTGSLSEAIVLKFSVFKAATT